MLLIDTHTHIYLDDFAQDRDIVIDRALKEGIGKILLPNIDSSSINNVLRLASEYPDICYAMLGLHPTSVNANYKKELEIIQNSLSKNPEIVAIGEIGLDLYWDKTYIKEQVYALEYQIKIANECSLPIAIHVRDAFPLIFDVMENNKNKHYGVFHCFSGDINDAKKIIDMGYYLGIGGTITYKNSVLPQIIKEIGINHIILETDAPYLSPVPYRGKRNEPAYIKIIAQKISDILEIDIVKVASITTNNAIKLFGLDKSKDLNI